MTEEKPIYKQTNSVRLEQTEIPKLSEKSEKRVQKILDNLKRKPTGSNDQ